MFASDPILILDRIGPISDLPHVWKTKTRQQQGIHRGLNKQMA